MTVAIQDIIERIERIPLISSHTMQILNLVGKTDFRIQELADLVALDFSLSSACLKAVNAAKFGLRRQVDTIEQAVSYLGSRQIVSMTLNGDMGDVLHAPLPGYYSESEELWDHSLYTAIASTAVSRLMFPGKSEGPVYAAGLLHDIGKAVLSEYLSGVKAEMREQLEQKQEKDFETMEREMLAHDHSEVGELLVKHWNLPPVFHTAVRWHHHPGEAKEKDRNICMAVHIGDLLAMLAGHGTGCDTLAYRIDTTAQEYFKNYGNALPRLMLEIETEYTSARDRLRELIGESNGETNSDRR
jgi:putative nucleotidyltransferase with HDIG domain